MSNETDPLVEAVARAICPDKGEGRINCGVGEPIASWQIFERDARAAIKAVLEWYSDPKSVTNCMMNAGDQEREAELVVAAAMAAELKRREG